MVTTRGNEITEEASPLVPPDVPVPMAIQKLWLWNGSGGRKTAEKQVKDSNSWAVPYCSTRHDTNRLTPLRSTYCLPVADDPPIPLSPIPDKQSGISKVKDSRVPLSTDSNIILSLENLTVAIRKNIMCKTCTLHFHHERRVRFHRYSDKYHKEMASEVLQSSKSTAEKLIALYEVASMNMRKVWVRYLEIEKQMNTIVSKCVSYE